MRRTALAALVLVAGACFAAGSFAADPEGEEKTAPANEGNVQWKNVQIQVLPQVPLPLRPGPERRQLLEPRPEGAPIVTCLARAGAEDDVCARGRAISRMRPCVDPDDCPAYEAWRGLYGEPRLVPAPAVPAEPATAAALASEAAAREDD